MILSEDLIRRVLEPVISDGGDIVSEYGEPGYDLRDGETPMIVLGDYWCKCGKNPHAGRPKSWGRDGETVQLGDLHSYDAHHPRIWQQMEAQGVELEWRDEWLVDYENDKCYRAHADRYSWSPTAIVTEWGDLLTPDSEFEDWLAWALNTPTVCLFPQYVDQLVEAGFEQWNTDSYESGWHPGQDDDPRKIFGRLSEQGYDEIVFVLDENSQFYSRFSVYTRQEVPA